MSTKFPTGGYTIRKFHKTLFLCLLLILQVSYSGAYERFDDTPFRDQKFGLDCHPSAVQSENPDMDAYFKAKGLFRFELRQISSGPFLNTNGEEAMLSADGIFLISLYSVDSTSAQPDFTIEASGRRIGTTILIDGENMLGNSFGLVTFVDNFDIGMGTVNDISHRFDCDPPFALPD